MAARVRGVDRPVALLGAMAYITQVGVAIMLPLLPLYATALGAEPWVLGLMTSAFAIAIAVGQLFGGVLAERFAARRLVTIGIGIYAAANVLIATAAAAVPLIAFRSLAGLGGGLNQVAERLYLVQVVDRSRLAFANGVLSAAGSAGTITGPAIGGLLVAVTDLRVPFLIVGVTSTLALIGSLFLPRSRRETPDGSPPTESGAASTDPTTSSTDLTRAVVTEPAAPSQRRTLLVLFSVQASFQATFGAFITTYAVFATERLGWHIAEVGIVFAMFGLGSVLLGPILARRADQRGRRDMAIVGALLLLAFPIVFVVGAPRFILYPVSIIGGAGVTALESSWFALLADATDGGRRSRAYGLVTALSSLGIVVGAMAASQAWEQSGDIGLGLLISAVTILVAAVLLLALPRDRGSEAAPA